MYHLYEITDEDSLCYAIKDYIRFYYEESPQSCHDCKTPAEVRNESMNSKFPKVYPIPENKRIMQYKGKLSSYKNSHTILCDC